MIITLDKVECKKGDRVWEIGVDENGYRPTMSIVHGSNNRVVNPDRCWKDYDLCLAECKKMNKERAVAG